MNRADLFADIASRQKRFTQALKSGRLSRQDSYAVNEHYAYVYKQGAALGMGRAGAAEPKGADDARGAIPFTVSVYEEDRDGDLVVPQGCMLKDYAKNPVVFFGHQQWEIPVGVARDPSGRLAVFPGQDRIKAVCYFDRADADADFLYGKCKRGILSAASIAFIPLEAYRREEVEKAQPHGNRPLGMPPGWLFKRYALTEWSIVGIPSCADAVREALDREKSFLSPRLRKGLSAYASRPSGCWPGWCPTKGDVMNEPCCDDCAEGKACKCDKMATQGLAEDASTHTYDNPPPGVRPDVQGTQKDQPSSDIDSDKACQIMRDGKVNGKPLTEAQRGMFGAACGRSQKGAKAMASNSGGSGGYLTDSGKVEEDGGKGSRLSTNEAPGYEPCATCDGSGNCPKCDGTGGHGHVGEECDECDGTGNCSTCDGMGSKKKPIPIKSRGPAKGRGTMRKASPPIEDNEDEDVGIPAAHEAGKDLTEPNEDGGDTLPGAYDEGKGMEDEDMADETAPGDAPAEASADAPEEIPADADVGADAGADMNADLGMKGSESEPFNPKPSAAVVGRLYQHNKAAVDYLDQELTNMDNPGMKAWLEGHKAHYMKAMEDLGAALGEHHPDVQMDKLMKALEAESPPTTGAGVEGEAGVVAAGNVPPERPTPTPPTTTEEETEGGGMGADESGSYDYGGPGAAPSEGETDAGDLGTPPYESGAERQTSDYGSSAPPEGAGAAQTTPDEEAEDAYGTPNVEEEAFTYNPEDAGTAPYQGGRGAGGKGNLEGDSGMADTDADTEEILERYRHPKSGKIMVRKWKVHKTLLPLLSLRKASDGRYYVVRGGPPLAAKKKLERPTTGEYIEGDGGSDELDEGDKPAPFNKQLARDVGGAGEFLADLSGDVAVHKAYRTVAKFHAQRLGFVEKELSNHGRLQRNSGGGRPLSDKGRTQNNSGGGEALSERGAREADSRSRAQIVGSGTPDGLSEGTKPAPYNSAKKQASPPARRQTPPAQVDKAYAAAAAEFASIRRMAKEFGILN